MFPKPEGQYQSPSSLSIDMNKLKILWNLYNALIKMQLSSATEDGYLKKGGPM